MVGTIEISDKEARSPEVEAALRARFRRNMGYAMVGIPVTVVSKAAVLWTKTDTAGLLLWAALALGSLALHWWWWFRHDPETDWSKGAVKAQAYGGVVWGLAPWLMLPHDPVWQALTTSSIVTLMAAGVGFSSAVRWGSPAFIVPIAVLAPLAYVVRGGGQLWGGAVLVVAMACFCLGLAAMTRASDIEAAVLFVRSHRLATVDGLTGALSRREFLSAAHTAVAESEATVGIAYLDIDKFKYINDSMGHAAGDELLIEVATRIKAMLGPNEVLGRMGGDELVVLSPEMSVDEDLSDLGARILGCFAEPFQLGDALMTVTCSVGIAGRSPGGSSERLMADADAAMYRAKRSDDRRGEVAAASNRQPVPIG